MLVYQSLDCFVVVVICGCADNGSVRHIGFCVFSLGSICVGLMFWIRVVVAVLNFVYLLFDVFHVHLVYVSPVALLLVCLACFCGWLVDFCVEFCVYLF